MLDPQLYAQLEAVLTRLPREIQLTATLDDSKGSSELKALLEDIKRASPKVRVDYTGDDKRVPSFSIHLPDEAPRVHFSGLPLGHEFTSLILALLHVAGYAPKESAETLERVKKLNLPLHFETYFSQSCQNCPDVVQGLNIMAALNPQISHVSIDGALFAEEVAERQIMAVPTVYLNGQPFGAGRMELGEILDKVDGGAGAEARKAALNARAPFDVLVVGGGPAGVASAIYAVRKGLDVGVVADRFGGQVMDTLTIENLISVIETEGPQLGAALEAHLNAYPVELIKQEKVKRVLGDGPFTIELEGGAELRARSVIVATGAYWRDMNVPGETEYRTKGVTYCPNCDGPLFKGKDVAVIGGGNSGVEAAIELASVVNHVTILELGDALRADDVLLKTVEKSDNISVLTGVQTTEITGDGQRATGLTYLGDGTEELQTLSAEGIFVQIGLIPNTQFIADRVDTTPTGEIIIDAKGQTSQPGIFAAGDATTTPYKQIITAMGDGAKAGLAAFDYLVRHATNAGDTTPKEA